VGSCSKEASIIFTPNVPSGAARIMVCITATDYVNHQTFPQCKEIAIDTRRPTPTELQLRDRDGTIITSVRSNQALTADLFVRIPSALVNGDTVMADLSKLNPNLGKVVRQEQSGEWFIWRNVQVTTPRTCQVTVEATSVAGSKEIKTLTCTIAIDDTPPEPVSLGTPFADEDGTPLIGVRGNITATLKETGGMNKANAFLDLRALGLGTEVKATACEKTSPDSWTCTWTVQPRVQTGTLTVKLLPTTRDDVNNQVIKTLQTNIRFDNTPPTGLRLKEIAAFRDGQRVLTKEATRGETLEFVVEGKEFSTAVADLTSIGGQSDTPTERCTGNTTKTCTFSSEVLVSGPQGTNITFTFSDKAGNIARLSTKDLTILGVSNETNPNYWYVATDCSPSVLDRQTLSVFEHPVYCRLRMISRNPKALPISVQGPTTLSQCTGQTNYVSTMRVENNYGGSSEPYLVLTLVPTDYTINELNLTCPVSTLTRVGNFVAQNSEIDNATVSLHFTSLPIGELYKNVDQRVRDVKKNVEDTWAIIGEMRKFISMAESVCNILNSVMNIIANLANVLAMFGAAEAVANAINFGIGNAVAAKIAAAERGLCTPTGTAYRLYNKDILKALKRFCDFLSCQIGLFQGLEALGFGDGLGKMDFGVPGFTEKWLSGEIVFGKSLGPVTQELHKTIAGEEQAVQNPASYLNVKDSLIYSIVVPPLCIPGIIYNLDKWRQIECKYGLCLLQDVRERGAPMEVCRDQQSYMQCRYVVGEIFNIVPFASLWTFFANLIQQMLSDPLVLTASALRGIAKLTKVLDCDQACELGTQAGTVYWICAAPAIIAQLGETVQNIQQIMSTQQQFKAINDQWCNQFDDALKNYHG
jgi:hypothetical protein